MTRTIRSYPSHLWRSLAQSGAVARSGIELAVRSARLRTYASTTHIEETVRYASLTQPTYTDTNYADRQGSASACTEQPLLLNL